MIITTTDSIEGHKIGEYLDIVCGSDSYNVAGVFGEGYTKTGKTYYRSTLERAISYMKQSAEEKNADAVVGIKIVNVQGNLNQMIVTVQGTAVKLEDNTIKNELPDL